MRRSVLIYTPLITSFELYPFSRVEPRLDNATFSLNSKDWFIPDKYSHAN